MQNRFQGPVTLGRKVGTSDLSTDPMSFSKGELRLDQLFEKSRAHGLSRISFLIAYSRIQSLDVAAMSP